VHSKKINPKKKTGTILKRILHHVKKVKKRKKKKARADQKRTVSKKNPSTLLHPRGPGKRVRESQEGKKTKKTSSWEFPH